MKNQEDHSREYGRRIAAPSTPSNNEPQRSAVIPIEVLHANRPWMFPVQPQGRPVPARCEPEMRPPTRQQLRR
jgi:hypothetical protein